MLIGPLQSNKAGLAADVFDRVESVDRQKIARRLSDARASSRGPMQILVQVNISGETTKNGVPPAEAVALAQAVASLPHLALRGFMGIAAPDSDVAAQRVQLPDCASASTPPVDVGGAGYPVDGDESRHGGGHCRGIDAGAHRHGDLRGTIHRRARPRVANEVNSRVAGLHGQTRSHLET